jgi:hypothetical protein
VNEETMTGENHMWSHSQEDEMLVVVQTTEGGFVERTQS